MAIGIGQNLEKKAQICVFSKLFIDEKDNTSTKFVLDSDFADDRKNTSQLFEENNNSCKYDS